MKRNYVEYMNRLDFIIGNKKKKLKDKDNKSYKTKKHLIKDLEYAYFEIAKLKMENTKLKRWSK